MMREHFELQPCSGTNLEPEKSKNDGIEDPNSSTEATIGPKIFWPRAVTQKFLDLASKRRILAYVCGYKDEVGNLTPTHLVFPTVMTTSVNVLDLGTNGIPTEQFLMQEIAPKINQPGHEFKVISWMRNAHKKAFFSDVVANSQQFYSQKFPGVFATFYALGQGTHRYDYDYEAFMLSDKGNATLDECENLAEKSLMASKASFYESVKPRIILTDSPITMIDGSDTKSVSDGQGPKFEIVEMNECRVCKRSFSTESALLYHVSRAKACIPSYEEEIGDFRAHVKRQKNAAAYEQRKRKKEEQQGEPIKQQKSVPLPQNEEKSDNFVCEICEASFTLKKNRDRHIREIHSPSDDVVCPMCNKSFSRPSKLAEHWYIVHDGNSDHKCEICHKSFTQSYHLTRHIMEVHSSFPGDKVKCPDCDKSFTRKEHMKEHWSFWHCEIGEYWKCGICEELFTRKWGLDRHIEEIHNLDRFICQECPAAYTRQENLDKHVQKGIHWQHVYCSTCQMVVKFDTKDERNWHCNQHGMPDKCVSLEDAKLSERWGIYRDGHIQGGNSSNCSCKACKFMKWLMKRREEIEKQRLKD